MAPRRAALVVRRRRSMGHGQTYGHDCGSASGVGAALPSPRFEGTTSNGGVDRGDAVGTAAGGNR